MKNQSSPTKKSYLKVKQNRYEAPAIIFEGFISTRAGSVIGKNGEGENGADPADLFGN